jgi:hypothetical protein
MEYKFRAECFDDVLNIIKNNKEVFNQILILNEDRYNVEVEFISDFKYTDIIESFKKTEDSHVIYQTLRLKKLYNGERNFDL